MNFKAPSVGWLRRFSLLTVAVAFLAVAVRCLNLFFFFDTDIGYYQSNTLLPIVEAVLLVLAVILLVLASFRWLRHMPVGYAPATPVSVKAVSFVAALLSVISVIQLMSVESTSLLPRFLVVLSVISAVYFLLGAWSKASLLPRFLSGLGNIVALVVSLALSYFDITVQMNAPNKIFFQLACLSLMLFTAEELRFTVGAPRKGLYFLSVGCAVLFGGIATIPSLIGIVAGVLEAPYWIPCYALLAANLIYAIARMYSLVWEEQAPSEESSEDVSDNEEA